MKDIRKKRIEGEIRKIISTVLINGEIKDPFISEGMITPTRVDISKDMGSARVYVSIFTNDDEEARKKTLRGLIRARGYIQYVLGKKLQLRRIPDLTFLISDTLEEGDRIVDMIERENRPEATETTETDDLDGADGDGDNTDEPAENK